MAHPAARSVTRLAIVLTMLAVPLFAARRPRPPDRSSSASPRERSTTKTSRGWRRPGCTRSASCSNGGRWSRAGAPIDWGERDHFIGRLASHGIRSVPFVWGSPQWVGSGVLAQPPISSDADKQAWRDFLKAAVARYGPGGSYWTTDYPEQFPGAAPLPIQSWQIWNEPNLKKFFSPGQNVQQSAQKYATLLADLPRRDQEPEIRRPGSCSPECPPSGTRRPGCSSTTSTRCPGSRATSTPPPCTPMRAGWTGFARRWCNSAPR